MSEGLLSWEELLKQLHRSFKQLDEGRSLLLSIDQSILSRQRGGVKETLESTFQRSLEALSRIYSLGKTRLVLSVYRGAAVSPP